MFLSTAAAIAGQKRRRSEMPDGDDLPGPSPVSERIGEFTLSLSERVKRRRTVKAQASGRAGDDDDDLSFIIERSDSPPPQQGISRNAKHSLPFFSFSQSTVNDPFYVANA